MSIWDKYEFKDSDYEMLKYIMQDKTIEEIATEMNWSYGTVKGWLGLMIKKAKCKNRTELIIKYTRAKTYDCIIELQKEEENPQVILNSLLYTIDTVMKAKDKMYDAAKDAEKARRMKIIVSEGTRKMSKNNGGKNC